jgi:hypothetical protein
MTVVVGLSATLLDLRSARGIVGLIRDLRVPKGQGPRGSSHRSASWSVQS